MLAERLLQTVNEKATDLGQAPALKRLLAVGITEEVEIALVSECSPYISVDLRGNLYLGEHLLVRRQMTHAHILLFER